ncbi:MAG: DUF1598 domain-containing protein [Planctomycetes bacterium]|nr:DUF1598 domain-containing protein [Planctomycetota bacterium]
MSATAPSRRPVLAVAAAVVFLFTAGRAWPQGTVQNVTQRPFVVGVVPVVGAGGVGGVKVDARGVVSRVDEDATGELSRVRRDALSPVPGSLDATSPLRMVSLGRLSAEILERKRTGRPLPDDVQYLAGMQTLRYVMVDLDEHDLVLAGFAEGWTAGAEGCVMGRTTGRPVLRLDDLVVALQSAPEAAEHVISCSIDPTAEGLARLRRLMARRSPRINAQTLAAMERAVGSQEVTFTSVPADSRFAHVLLAADVRMKRLAMGFEASPVAELPSYLELVQASGERPQSATPRWWLAPEYEPLARDAEGLIWELRGRRIIVETDEDARGSARRWAELFTRHYERVAEQIPVFRELAGAIDLAVVAALIEGEGLVKHSGCDLRGLADPQIVAAAQWPVPKTLDTRASTVRRGRDWVIALSGGVQIDSWAVAERTERGENLPPAREQLLRRRGTRWWWD